MGKDQLLKGGLGGILCHVREEQLDHPTYNTGPYLEGPVPAGLAGGKLWNDSNHYSARVTHGCQ